MRRIALPVFALVLTVAACDRGRVETLERRVEALEKKDLERAPTVAPDPETTKSIVELKAALATTEAARVEANERIAALTAQLAELQLQHERLQKQLGEAGSNASAASTGPIGIKACDEYIEKYTRCIEEKLPAAARESMKDAMAASVKAWKEAAAGPAREGLAIACQAALEAASTATASFGCTW